MAQDDNMPRIIAGRAGGRSLRTPAGDQTRPTSDRVREALFSTIASWLGSSDEAVDEQLADIAFLDLFAGSGAVGLEAASRGAAQVVLVDDDRHAADSIAKNIRETKLPAKAIKSSVQHFLAGPPTRFDIIWADPPYRFPSDALDELLTQLAANWLGPNGLLVVERAKRDTPPLWPQAASDSWERRYGETVLYFAQFDEQD